MIEMIRRIIDAHGRLNVAARDLSLNSDLYEAGLTSFAAVQIMLALEDELDIEFPEHMLRRQSLSSINSILSCLRQLLPEAA
jgi:acyl carrier protein